jgi:hypothetical protein
MRYWLLALQYMQLCAPYLFDTILIKFPAFVSKFDENKYAHEHFDC